MDGLYEISLEAESGLMEVGQVPVAVPNPTDVLIDKVRSGDLAAFEGLMVGTEKLVLGVAWRILGDRELARDAAQETFLRAYRSLDRFRLGENFQAWLCQITVNVCRDLARKRGPVTVDLEVLEAPHPEQRPVPRGPALAAEAALLLSERRAMVQGALAALPPGERTALVLRDIEGFSTEDVARVLGVRPVTIRTQIASARAKVRAYCDHLLQRPSGGPT